MNKEIKQLNKEGMFSRIKQLMGDGRCTQTIRKTLVKEELANKSQANDAIRVTRKEMGIYVKNSGKHFIKSKKSMEVFNG